MAGYGIVKLNKRQRTITFECWPRFADPATGGQQYAGWPISIKQTDNYARTPVAYLPRIEVTGMVNPIVQVVSQETNEIVYTLRISGRSYRPGVFGNGQYTIHVGEQPDQMKTFKDILAQPDRDERTLKVSF